MVAVAQTRHMVAAATAAAILFACLLTACRTTPSANVQETSDQLVLELVRVPSYVTRVAVWYPRTVERDVAYGYMKLEQATFQIKQHRPWIRIVDRRNLETMIDEQRLQVSGRVEDDSAISIGKWLGADSLVLFQIQRPTWRDRVWARMDEQMAPVVVTSKIISVETGEVLYHDIVRILPVSPRGTWDRYGTDAELQPVLRASLDQAVSVAIAHLTHSFR